MFIFVTKSVVEMFQLRVCESELEFGYNAKMGGYVNMGLDIPELYEIVSKGKLSGWIMYTKNLERYRNNLHKNDMTFRDFKRYKSLEIHFIYTMILFTYNRHEG